MSSFEEFDVSDFWEDSDYARESFVDLPPSDELIASIEVELGVRLPASYVELMKTQNGGIPRNCCFPTDVPTSWAKDHVAITGIMGIGRDKTYSLCGSLGSKFMQEEWGYPEIGVCICNCPSAGHDMIMLDYRKCGMRGEPEVVHVDQECDFEITFLARDFATFLRGLVNESVYDTSADDLKADLEKIENGSFSTVLSRLIAGADEDDFGSLLRNVCRQLTTEKGYFALHSDELSTLVYDILFYLYTKPNKVATKEDYLEVYPNMLAFGDGEFTTAGYAPGFVKDWIADRLSKGEIVRSSTGTLQFSDEFQGAFARRISQLNAG